MHVLTVWLITRSDRSDQWGNDSTTTTVEALTGADPEHVQARALARLAELEEGADDFTGHPADELTTYAADQVATVDGVTHHSAR